ncbi:MAG: class I SAM-dependent methyltransferase [Casimicrobiaceae bacterium]|nr:class I SAM-dependent methyltransferase [Betaproteobacteria bacterium]
MPAYGPLATLFYDADKPRASDAEVMWYAQRLPREQGLSLEAMCGSGRLLVPLVARGLKCHGVDNSSAMLASCEARIKAAGLTAPVFRQDIAQMNLPFRYTAILIVAGSFQLITDPATAASALQRLRAHLIAPGLLLMDMYVPSESTQRLGAPLVEVRTAKLDDGSQIALRSETTVWADARLSRSENRYAHRRGTERVGEERETLTLTWYPPDEIAALVADAGFHDVTIGPPARAIDDAQTFSLTARL